MGCGTGSIWMLSTVGLGDISIIVMILIFFPMIIVSSGILDMYDDQGCIQGGACPPPSPRLVSEHTLSLRQDLWGNEPRKQAAIIPYIFFLETTVTNPLTPSNVYCWYVYYISRFTSIPNMINSVCNVRSHLRKSPVHTENQNARLLSGMPQFFCDETK